jgi:hypothetical protein
MYYDAKYQTCESKTFQLIEYHAIPDELPYEEFNFSSDVGFVGEVVMVLGIYILIFCKIDENIQF